MASGQQAVQEALMAALGSVREPSGKTLMEAQLVAGIVGEENKLTIRLKESGWPDPIKERIGREVGAAVQAKLPQMSDVSVEWAGEGGQAEGPDIKHVIAVGSGKGGVGKSTVAASLAYALTIRGHRVGLMDADVYGPSIPHMVGLEGRPAVANNRYQPLAVDGVKVISMGFLVPPNQAVVWRGPMLHKAVRDFLYSVEWGPLDYLIVDLPPGTGDVVLSLSQQMPLAGAVIVCTPQDVALLDARKALSMFQTVKIPCRGIVENMSFFICPECRARTEIFGHGGAEQWAKEVGVPFLGSIPINVSIRKNGDAGTLRDNFAEGSIVRDQLLSLADNLLATLAASASPAAPTLEIV